MYGNSPAGVSSGLAGSVTAAAGAAAAAPAAGAVVVSAGLSPAGFVGSASVFPPFLDFFLKAALSLALRLSRAPRAAMKNYGLAYRLA